MYCVQQLEELENNFQTCMQQLKETVQAKSAVPTAHVYVSKSNKFISLVNSDLIFKKAPSNLTCL